MSTTSVFLHPLAILNITDQYTRALYKKYTGRLVGALIGIQSGRNIEIFTTLEIAFDPNTHLIDTDTLDKQKNFATKVLPAFGANPMYEVVGWYSVGKDMKP